MDASQSKPTGEHQSKNANILQSKQQILQVKENILVGEITTTNITDLHDDCLVKIFECLDIQTLFNVAFANVLLRPAAVEVYKNRFNGKIIQLQYDRSKYCGECIHQTYITSIIHVYGLKTCLQYLRCFGLSIKNLQIDYSFSKNIRHAYVHQYINTYCVDNLEEIKLSCMPEISITHFVKPFVKVRSVIFIYCDLGDNLPDCAEWFPNLRYLKFENVSLADDFDRVNFQRLEHLCLIGIIISNQKYITLQNTANLLHSNRQLKKLEMNSNFVIGLDTWLNMIKDHSFITKLDLRRSSEMFFNRMCVTSSLQINQIANEHSSLIKLNLRGFILPTDHAIALTHQLKSLKTFDFRIVQENITQLESSLDQNKWILMILKDSTLSYVRLNRKN